ncbi:MAG: hypothetical protein EOP53_02695 [Sphingobacteriales bacterium]|nr:MAG: hypothetical protein EOP53_02695 [Sphingobacteriales bacterium]
MGKGKKTQRGMNVLIRVLKRKRQLKKASPKSFVRPEGLGNAPKTEAVSAEIENTENAAE